MRVFVFDACLKKVAATGWFSVGFAPMTMTTSESAHAVNGAVTAPEPIPSRERHHRRGVAKARAVVDVVGAEAGADHLLDEVRLLVRPLGGTEPGEGAPTVPVPDALEAGRRPIEGLLPARLAEVGPGVRGVDGGIRGLRRVVATNEGPGQPVRVRDVVETEAALDAQALLVRRPVPPVDGRDAVTVVDPVRDLAPDPAVGADALDLPEGKPPVRPRLVHERRLHERPRRTRLHALAAGDAGALAHRIVEIEDDARPVPPVGHADDVVHLHLAARPHAQVALDTGVEGDLHRRVGGVGGGGGLAHREAALVESDPIRPAPEARAVLVGGVARGLIGEEQLEHAAARVAGALRVRLHRHARRRVADARRGEDPLAPPPPPCTRGSCRPAGSRARPSGRDGESPPLRGRRPARWSLRAPPRPSRPSRLKATASLMVPAPSPCPPPRWPQGSQTATRRLASPARHGKIQTTSRAPSAAGRRTAEPTRAHRSDISVPPRSPRGAGSAAFRRYPLCVPRSWRTGPARDHGAPTSRPLSARRGRRRGSR